MEEDDFPEVDGTIKGYLSQFRETGKAFVWIWRHVVVSTARKWIVNLSILMMLKSILEMIQPYLIALIIKHVRDTDMLIRYLVLFTLVRIIYSYFGSRLSQAREWIFGAIFQSLDDQITRLFFEKSVGQHIQEGSELSIANIDKGRGRVWNLTFTMAFQVIPIAFGFTVTFIALWFISPVIGGIATAAVGIFVLWMLWLNVRTMKVCVPIEKDFRSLNRYRLERWEHSERVKLRNQTGAELKEMDQRFTKAIVPDRNHWIWFGGQVSYREHVITAAILGMIVYAIIQSRHGVWDVAMLFPIFMWSLKLANDLDQLGHIEREVSWSMPAIQSMIRALTMPPDVDECLDGYDVSKDPALHIEICDVDHSYPERRMKHSKGSQKESGRVDILRGLHFTIEPGEKVALIGPSGAGKTTLMRLITRAMDPTSGCIKVNGRDLREIALPNYLQRVAYIPQHPRVFDGTIRYNLTYGLKEKPSDDELRDLLARLALDDPGRFVDGLDTIVGRNGLKLSGGQLQRLIVGAAIIQKANLMVIDEATSHLDSTTEKEVLKHGLSQALTPNVSALIIAHRLSTVEDTCTKYIVLKPLSAVKPGESQIDAIGSSYKELYETSAVFKGLADDQHLLIRGYRRSLDFAQKGALPCFAS